MRANAGTRVGNDMPVKVRFPDGTEREVPSRTRIEQSREIGGPHSHTFHDEPIFDPDWKFVPVIGGWIARPRR